MINSWRALPFCWHPSFPHSSSLCNTARLICLNTKCDLTTPLLDQTKKPLVLPFRLFEVLQVNFPAATSKTSFFLSPLLFLYLLSHFTLQPNPTAGYSPNLPPVFPLSAQNVSHLIIPTKILLPFLFAKAGLIFQELVQMHPLFSFTQLPSSTPCTPGASWTLRCLLHLLFPSQMFQAGSSPSIPI